MNILENLILKFQDYLRPSYQSFGGQFSGEDLRMSVYVKTDRKLYFQDNLGVEHQLSHLSFPATDHQHHRLDADDGSPTSRVYVDFAGNVGIGIDTDLVTPFHVVGSTLIDGQVNIDDHLIVSEGVSGRWLACLGASIELDNGENNNIAPSTTGHCQVAGPTAAFSITGIANAEHRQFLVLHNVTSQNMTLVHNSPNSTDINRIYCPGSVNQVTSGAGWALLFYAPGAGGVGGWLVLSFAP